MFKQPTEKRKKAATSVNLSTWWERIVAPMLKAKSAFEFSSDEHCNQEERDYLQCLENPEWAEAKLRTEDREKAVEEGHRPRDLGKEEKDELEDDEKTVDHCPEGTCSLIGNCAASERYTNRVSITIYQTNKGNRRTLCSRKFHHSNVRHAVTCLLPEHLTPMRRCYSRMQVIMR